MVVVNYFNWGFGFVMWGDQEEVQEQMKADMSALKEQMASMMEAMLGMK